MTRKLLFIALIALCSLHLGLGMKGSARVEARLEVARIAAHGEVPYTVHLTNSGEVAAADLRLVGEAGGLALDEPLPVVERGTTVVHEGVLHLEQQEGRAKVVLRVEGALPHQQTFMVALPEGRGGARLYTQMQQISLPPSQSQQFGNTAEGTLALEPRLSE